MGGIIPRLGPEYRTTTGMYKWIALGVAVGAMILYFVLREAVRESDDIYDKSGLVPRTTNAPAAPH